MAHLCVSCKGGDREGWRSRSFPCAFLRCIRAGSHSTEEPSRRRWGSRRGGRFEKEECVHLSHLCKKRKGGPPTTGEGLSTDEDITQVSSNGNETPHFGQGAVDPQSQVSDCQSLINNSPLPSDLKIVYDQYIIVGGISVRENTLTWTSSGLTIANDGPTS